MSKAKHTAGPWRAVILAGYSKDTLIMSGTDIVASLVKFEGKAANARLIAEAPTLLSELEVSTSIMESLINLFGESMAMSTKFGLTSQIESNKELIKKIEG